MLLKYAVQLLAAASCVASASTIPDIKHMKILDEALPDDKFISDLYTRFRPYLKVDKGSCCTPFPVVDAKGTSGGKPVIDTLKDCQKPDGEGQIYARGLNTNDPANVKQGQFAIMYSWYFPAILDSFVKWETDDWQQVIVWLSGNGADANNYHISHVAYSQPDGYMQVPAASTTQGSTHPHVLYTKIGEKNGLNGRGLMPKKEEPGYWPYKMITWEKFTDQARASVNNTKNFENDKVAPFSDFRFAGHINASAIL